MNCKPGTIGRINKNCRRKENLGLFVEVVRQYLPGEILPGHKKPYRDDGEFGWVVRCFGRSLLVENQTGNFLATYGAVRDHAITPFGSGEGDESFVTETRKHLTITQQNDKLKKVPA